MMLVRTLLYVTLFNFVGTVTVKPGRCPTISPDTGGICVEDCSSDADCDRDLKCCSNGCGHTCQEPVAADEKSHLIPHGDNITLRCPLISGLSRTDWAKVFGGPESSTAGYNRIVEDCAVMQSYTSLYDVTTDAVTGVCNLVIVSARKEHGGRYVCYDERDIMSDKLFLSVLETNVIGSQSAVQAVGGDVVNYTCHILYHGDVSPSMAFSPQDLRVGIPYNVVVINDTISYDVSTTSVRVPDGPATVPSYTCSVFDWNAHWSSVYFWKSTPITVSFCLKNVQITGAGNGSSVPGGTQLTCSAEAHPSASYTWTDDVSNTVVEGSTFRVVSMQYHNLTCTATNNITYADGRIQSCTGSVYFQVDAADDDADDGIPTVLIIAVCCGVGAVLLVIIVVVIVICVIKKHKPVNVEDRSRTTETGSSNDYSPLNMTSLNADVPYASLQPTYSEIQ